VNSVPIIWETPQERVVATCLSLAILATNSAKNQLISISMSAALFVTCFMRKAVTTHGFCARYVAARDETRRKLPRA